MLTLKISPRNLMLTTATAISVMTATPLAAADDAPAISFSANAALVNDYRFRGVSLSNKDFAIQGGFDISSDSGFYVGTWGSSIEQYEGSELELDIYGGYATSLDDLDFDIGVLAYTYPGSVDTTYWEAYSSVGGTAGKLAWTLGAAYAFDQSSIGGDDNIYLYVDLGAPIGQSPFSVATHFAYEDGAFGDDKLDWSLGLSYDHEKFSLGVAYVDTNIDSNISDAGVVVSLSSAF